MNIVTAEYWIQGETIDNLQMLNDLPFLFLSNDHS